MLGVDQGRTLFSTYRIGQSRWEERKTPPRRVERERMAPLNGPKKRKGRERYNATKSDRRERNAWGEDNGASVTASPGHI